MTKIKKKKKKKKGKQRKKERFKSLKKDGFEFKCNMNSNG